MTINQLQKKLEYYEAGDYNDLLIEIITKHPEVKSFLEIKFGFVDENKILEKYKQKVLKELSKKWVDSDSWYGDDIYYKYKPTKAKEYIKEFGKICKDKKNLLLLMFFYFFEYSQTIDKKEEEYRVLQSVYKGRNQVFSDICKEIKKQGNAEIWYDQIVECLKLTKIRSVFIAAEGKPIRMWIYPLESDLKDILGLNKEDLGKYWQE